MNKNTKTTLIVALSLFGAGVLIWLCVSLGIGFNFSKLTPGFRADADGTISDSTSVKAERIEKNVEANGQNISLNVGYADIRLEKSADADIHISYTNTEDSYFDLESNDSKIVLTQHQNGHFFFFSFFSSSGSGEVVVSIPDENIGNLDVDVASGEVSVSDIKLSGDFKLDTASGDVSLDNSKIGEFSANSASGKIYLSDVDTDNIDINTASGDISLSKIKGNIPVTLDTVSAEVYIEDVETEDLSIGTVSGNITLKDVLGKTAGLSTTSGGVELNSADFLEIRFKTVSGDISGAVVGSAEDYTVYTNTISGSNSLSGHREHGKRTLDLSSTSGSFEIRFEK